MQLSQLAKQARTLVESIDGLLEANDGHALSNQAAKLAIVLEQILEHKADAKRLKQSTYANEYEKHRQTESQGDAKIYADAKKDVTYDHIEALESGIKSVLSTVKDKLHWLELEYKNWNS